jgi:hypothetical protein
LLVPRSRQGAEGDLQAIREVADRLDGKVAQAIAGDDELPPVSIIITGVVRDGDPRAEVKLPGAQERAEKVLVPQRPEMAHRI